MKTTSLTAIALALAIAAPAVAQAATSKPPASTKQTGLKPGFKLSNPRAKKPKAQKKHRTHKKHGVRARASWVYAGVTGSAGAVTVATPIHAMHITYPYGTFLQLQNPAGPTVSRSPATAGAQDAVIYYSTQVYINNQWVERTGARGSVRIPAGYSAGRLPHLTSLQSSLRGYLRVVEVIYWYVAGTDTLLGATVITPNQTSDLVCTTPVQRCTSYGSFLQFG